MYSILLLILGWLQPLLDVLARNSSHVVSPLIANICDDTFELRFPPGRLTSSYKFFIGGFDWNLQVSGHDRFTVPKSLLPMWFSGSLLFIGMFPCLFLILNRLFSSFVDSCLVKVVSDVAVCIVLGVMSNASMSCRYILFWVKSFLVRLRIHFYEGIHFIVIFRYSWNWNEEHD